MTVDGTSLQLRAIFKVLDKANLGTINVGALCRGLETFGSVEGDAFTMDEMEAFMSMANRDPITSKDDDLNYEDFLQKRDEILEEYGLR